MGQRKDQGAWGVGFQLVTNATMGGGDSKHKEQSYVERKHHYMKDAQTGNLYIKVPGKGGDVEPRLRITEQNFPRHRANKCRSGERRAQLCSHKLETLIR